jgi:DeoR/GlpR family transcriptional regulator of sugar metabolism
MSPLLLKERHDLILRRLQDEGRVLAPDLALALKVSEDTIRRDLRDLAAAGLCEKVYGGALSVPLPPDHGSLTQRRAVLGDEKSRLARAAAAVVRPGQLLFIDAGSTNLCIAEALPEVPLTVATNAPAIAAALLDRPLIELIVIGGQVDKHLGASVGPVALREAAQLRPDLFLLGACGVDARAGVTANHYEEAEFKRRMAAQSGAVLAAATSDKLATAAPFAVLPPHGLSTLVLSADADPRQARAFSKLGVQLLRAAH